MKVVKKNGNGNAQSGSVPKINATGFKDADDVLCEKCKCKVFQEKLIIKMISKFIAGSDRDQIAPIPVFVCAECNHINEIFKPNL